MNLRIFEERTTRSRSPKRYSLNRKIKWKERKQFTDIIEVEKSLSSPFSSRDTAENGSCGKELECYEMWRTDCRGMENSQVSLAYGVPLDQDHRVCLNSPVTESMRRGPLYRPSEITSQKSSPVSPQSSLNASSMLPCSSTDFRIISRPIKRKPQKQFYGQAVDASCNLSHTQHYVNFQGMEGLQTPSLLHSGGMNTSHFSTQWNNLQESQFVQAYMTPIQSTGFQFNSISRQRNGEAYNAFTAYGNPFGVFWSGQN